MNDPFPECAADHAQKVVSLLIHAGSDSASTPLDFDIAVHIAAIPSEFGPGPCSFDHSCYPISIFWIDKADLEVGIIIGFDLTEAAADQTLPLANPDPQRTDLNRCLIVPC